MNRKAVLRITLFTAIWGVSTTSGISGEESTRSDHTAVTILAKAAKRSFQTDEPVILAIALANFGDKSVYVPVAESQVFEPSFRVKDANGVVVAGVAIDDPNRTVPPHYYVQRDGKRVLMTPVLEVKARGLLLTFIPNALKNYRQRLAPGRYYLEPSGFPMMLDARSVVSRPDYPNQLWVEAPSAPSVTTIVKHEPIEIVIESPTGVPKKVVP